MNKHKKLLKNRYLGSILLSFCVILFQALYVCSIKQKNVKMVKSGGSEREKKIWGKTTTFKAVLFLNTVVD